MVVAADGVESKIARMAGLNTSLPIPNSISCYQYEMAGIDIERPNRLYFYLGANVAPGGYIWIFPKGDHIANVGIGFVLGKSKSETAKYYLDKWIESMPSIKKGSIIEENAGGIPFGNFLKKMTADNFLAVGDAAHQVNPMHGGGIAEAINGARLAARVIARAIREEDTTEKNLDEYNRVWWDMHGKNLARIEKIVNECLSLSDEEINKITDSISSEGVLKLLNGDLGFAAKIIMKNPRIAMIAAKAL
ncbi:Digeranylgeranylglycerophospholipid reductase [uncultured archaeon]|nr:Digeranylgeranylglycerophospholipid reductase [uncultured archaeon]